MPLSSDDPKFQRPVSQNNGPSLDPKKKPGDLSMTGPHKRAKFPQGYNSQGQRGDADGPNSIGTDGKQMKRRKDGSYIPPTTPPTSAENKAAGIKGA